MSTGRCPRCAAAVAAGETRCGDCGLALDWRDVDETQPPVGAGRGAADDDETQPVGAGRGVADVDTEPPVGAGRGAADVDTEPPVGAGRGAADVDTEPPVGAGPGAADVDTQPQIVVRRDAPGDAEPPRPTAVGGRSEHDDVGQARAAGPSSAARPNGAGQDALAVRCPACGTSNPVQRTLCERCGMGLLTGEELLERDRSWWRPGRWLRVLLVTVLLAGGSLIAWSAVSDVRGLGPGDDAAGGDPGVGGGAAAPSPAPTAPPDEAAPPDVVLGPGSSGADVLQWQQLLADAGVDIQADGVYGRATTRATRRFQRTIGEEPTGRPTTRTLEAAQRASSLRLVTVYFVRGGQLDGVRRRVEETQLARGALEALIAGPLAAERDTGLSSAIPAGTMVGGVRVDRGVATVSLTGFAEDPGPQQLRERVDQVVRTLTRFPSIEAVRFRLPPDASSVFDEAGVAIDGG